MKRAAFGILAVIVIGLVALAIFQPRALAVIYGSIFGMAILGVRQTLPRGLTSVGCTECPKTKDGQVSFVESFPLEPAPQRS